MFRILILVVVCANVWGCSKGTSSSSSSGLSLPLGAALSGVTLSGSLAGKSLYLLGGNLNHSSCWQDSEFWDGTTLWFALTSISWTKLAATTPSYAADPGCSLPATQVGNTVFNLYSATLNSGSWSLINLALNTGVHSFGAPKISGGLLAYVSYEKTANDYGNIYLSQQLATNSWSSATAFSQNTTACNEDNPVVYANGSKMIFESSRTNAAGTACAGDSSHQQLWQSSLAAGVWSAPTAVVGAPTLAVDATQPWVEESTGKLYYTGDSTVCGGSSLNCVLEVEPSGSGWSSVADVILQPAPLVAGQSGGKVVLIGQFTKANGYAVASCGIATETDPTGSTPTLLGSRWTIYFSACVIPL